jgi:hypothetical protein
MVTEITSKSTKAEIIEAYEDLLEKVKTAKNEMPKQVQEEKQKTAVVNKVEAVTQTGITGEIALLKNNLGSSLDKLLSELQSEFTKLEEIRNAISVEKQNLEDLYSLSSTTDSLATMLIVQKEKKEEFERFQNEQENALSQKISAEKDAFENEIKLKRLAEKDYSEQLEKNRKREEEEYLYSLKINRQAELDTYKTQKVKQDKELSDKKIAFDQEMTKRENDLKNAEAELMELRKNNEGFPKKLELALLSKEKEITENLKIKFDFESQLLAKQNEGELKLKEQTISSLKEKITEMQIQIKELTEKANKAENSVKDIAVKAIESSSKIQVFSKKENEEK